MVRGASSPLRRVAEGGEDLGRPAGGRVQVERPARATDEHGATSEGADWFDHGSVLAGLTVPTDVPSVRLASIEPLSASRASQASLRYATNMLNMACWTPALTHG